MMASDTCQMPHFLFPNLFLNVFKVFFFHGFEVIHFSSEIYYFASSLFFVVFQLNKFRKLDGQLFIFNIDGNCTHMYNLFIFKIVRGIEKISLIGFVFGFALHTVNFIFGHSIIQQC